MNTIQLFKRANSVTATQPSTFSNIYPFSSFIHNTPRGSWIRVTAAGNHRHTRDAHVQPASNLPVHVNIDFKECATSTTPVAPVGVTRCVQGVGKQRGGRSVPSKGNGTTAPNVGEHEQGQQFSSRHDMIY